MSALIVLQNYNKHNVCHALTLSHELFSSMHVQTNITKGKKEIVTYM